MRLHPKTISKIKVLLAEDNAISQHVVSTYLKQTGHHVDIASNGHIAWKMLQTTQYDLLLTDIHMPELSGLELIEKIRMQTNQHITIVVLSAYATENLRQQCLQAGANIFFSKPLRLDKLKQALSIVTSH